MLGTVQADTNDARSGDLSIAYGVLASVVFTDVGSTARAPAEYDARWRTTLAGFQTAVRRELRGVPGRWRLVAVGA
jgi:hypothetical protein